MSRKRRGRRGVRTEPKTVEVRTDRKETKAPGAHADPSWVMRILLGICLIVACVIVNDYGIGWDESLHAGYAERVIDYMRTTGQDKSCNDFYDLKSYVPTVDLAAAAVYRWLPNHKYLVRHCLCALLAISALPALFRIGKAVNMPWAGVLGAVVLMLSPRFVGHAFINTKDIPFAAVFCWVVWSVTNYLSSERKTEDVFWCAVSIGALAAIRSTGLAFAGILFGVCIFVADLIYRRGLLTSRATYLHGAVVLGVAWIMMVIPWPWAHESPIMNPIRSMKSSTDFHTVIPVLYTGEQINSDELPRSYLPTMLGITTPIPILLLAGFGLGCVMIQQLRRKEIHIGLLVAQAWLLVPLILYLLVKPNIYDGIRHFLFLVPAIAMWAGIGLVLAWNIFSSWGGRFGIAVFCTLSAALILVETVSIHPYQLAYYNRLVDGVKGAERRYETEYWLTSYREAMEWVAKQEQVGSEPMGILVGANAQSLPCAAEFAAAGVTVKNVDETGLIGRVPFEYRYYIGSYRFGLDDNFPQSRIVQRIQRKGVTFAVVRER